MNLQEAYYESRFENAFLHKKGDEFQTFFEQLMGLAYKGDFIPCRPWGRKGDEKNDGFLKSERCLYQVYAPNEMTEKEATEKITTDFEGAKIHWRKYFDKWSFVHNSIDGLPPHVHKLILELEKRNPGIKIDVYGLEELRLIFRRLTKQDLETWFGAAPNEEIKINLGFKDIQIVLESLEGKAVPVGTMIKEVPSGKIEANNLSECVTILLTNGMTKAPLVSDFLNKWHDETLGERLAESFREEYNRLRGKLHPNLIFSELQMWIGGNQRGTAEHEMAILAVLSYYFERCDIFEEPRKILK